MLVKKFEAQTMKEALDLVKKDLGPEAIILSVKDHNKKYGIAGGNSVEITAAVSETRLHVKKLAEKKLTADHLESFRNSSVRMQKDFLEKTIQKISQKNQQQNQRQNQRIAEENKPFRSAAIYLMDDHGEIAEEPSFSPRVKIAAQSARSAAQFFGGEAVAQTKDRVTRGSPSANTGHQHDVSILKNEIEKLQKVIEGFQKVPQGFNNSHPGAQYGIGFDFSFMYEKLVNAGISNENTAEILLEAQNQISSFDSKKPAIITAWVAKYLMDQIKVASPQQAKVHVFVGGSGSGKTSTLVKYASHLVIKDRKNVAIVSTDSKKLGSSEQLKIYARILNVPFAMIQDKNDWERLWPQLMSMDVILVDTPGFALKEMQEIDQLRAIQPPREFSKVVHYVQAATVKDADAFELAARYKSVNFNDVIFTTLDESVQHGLIFNFQKKFQVPLHSFGTGPRIPEDYEPATKERVLDLIFKLSKMKGN